MKNASVRQPLSMEPLPFPCHHDRSEAERRDLRFYGPFLEMFFDGAKRLADLSPNRGFTARSRRTPRMPVGRCSSQLSGHQNDERNQKVTTSERSRGICSSTDHSWKRVIPS